MIIVAFIFGIIFFAVYGAILALVLGGTITLGVIIKDRKKAQKKNGPLQIIQFILLIALSAIVIVLPIWEFLRYV